MPWSTREVPFYLLQVPLTLSSFSAPRHPIWRFSTVFFFSFAQLPVLCWLPIFFSEIVSCFFRSYSRSFQTTLFPGHALRESAASILWRPIRSSPVCCCDAYMWAAAPAASHATWYVSEGAFLSLTPQWRPRGGRAETSCLYFIEWQQISRE